MHNQLSTNSLAACVTQSTSSNQSEYPDNKEAINRVNKNDMTKPIDYDINVERYNGPLNRRCQYMQLT